MERFVSAVQPRPSCWCSLCADSGHAVTGLVNHSPHYGQNRVVEKHCFRAKYEIQLGLRGRQRDFLLTRPCRKQSFQSARDFNRGSE